jgi:hypothetical protein
MAISKDFSQKSLAMLVVPCCVKKDTTWELQHFKWEKENEHHHAAE